MENTNKDLMKEFKDKENKLKTLENIIQNIENKYKELEDKTLIKEKDIENKIKEMYEIIKQILEYKKIKKLIQEITDKNKKIKIEMKSFKYTFEFIYKKYTKLIKIKMTKDNFKEKEINKNNYYKELNYEYKNYYKDIKKKSEKIHLNYSKFLHNLSKSTNFYSNLMNKYEGKNLDERYKKLLFNYNGGIDIK